jgi:hypothetical protein
MDLETLETLDSKLDVNLVEDILKSVDNELVVSHFEIFKFSILVHQLEQQMVAKKKLKVEPYIQNIQYYLLRVKVVDFDLTAIIGNYLEILQKCIDNDLCESINIDSVKRNTFEKIIKIQPTNLMALEYLSTFKRYKLKWIESIKEREHQLMEIERFAVKLYETGDFEDLNELIQCHQANHDLKLFQVRKVADVQPTISKMIRNFEPLHQRQTMYLYALYGENLDSPERDLLAYQLYSVGNTKYDRPSEWRQLKELWNMNFDQYGEKFIELWNNSSLQHELMVLHVQYVHKFSRISVPKSSIDFLKHQTWDKLMEWIMTHVHEIALENVMDPTVLEGSPMSKNMTILKVIRILLDVKHKTFEEIHSILLRFLRGIDPQNIATSLANFDYVFLEASLTDESFKVCVFKLSMRFQNLKENLFEYFLQIIRSFGNSDKAVDVLMNALDVSESHENKPWKKWISKIQSVESSTIISVDYESDLKHSDWKLWYMIILITNGEYVRTRESKNLGNMEKFTILMIKGLLRDMIPFWPEFEDLYCKIDPNYVKSTSFKIVNTLTSILSWNSPTVDNPFHFEDGNLFYPREAVKNVLSWVMEHESRLVYPTMFILLKMMNLIEKSDFKNPQLIRLYCRMLGNCALVCLGELIFQVQDSKQFILDLAMITTTQRFAEVLNLLGLKISNFIQLHEVFHKASISMRQFSKVLCLFYENASVTIYQQDDQFNFEFSMPNNQTIRWQGIPACKFDTETQMSSLLISLDKSLKFEEFGRIGPHCFVVSSGTQQTLLDVVASSKRRNTEALNFTPWFTSQFMTDPLLKWNTITKSKVKKSTKVNITTNSFQLFGNEYQSIQESIVKNFAKWICFGQVFNISNSIDNFVMQVNDGQIIRRNLSYLFTNEDNEALLPCIDALCILSKHGRLIFDDVFDSTLKSIVSPVIIQRYTMLLHDLMIRGVSISHSVQSEITLKSFGKVAFESDESKYNIRDTKVDIYLLKMMRRKLKMSNLVELEQNVNDAQVELKLKKSVGLVEMYRSVTPSLLRPYLELLDAALYSKNDKSNSMDSIRQLLNRKSEPF